MATFIFHCVFVLALGNVINCLRMRSVEYQTLSAKIKLINEAVGKYSSLDRDVASMKHELIDMKAELLDEKALTSSLLKLLNVSESEAHLPTKDILQRVENLHQKPDHTTSYSDEINSLGIEMKKLKETNTENLSKTYRFIREQQSLIRELQMDIQDTNNNLTKLKTLTHQMETNLQELQSLSNKQQPDSYRKDINKSTNVFRNAFLEEKAERKELEKRMLGSINRANDNISELENATTETKHQLIILEKVIENQDCNRLFNNDVIYTAPEYQNNRNCIVIVSNKQLPGHVVQVQFNKFELEESADCRFDYLKLQSGEKEGSPVIGRSYCGKSLEGRTIVTNGSSLRLEFKTDASVALYGFQANISFVRNAASVRRTRKSTLNGRCKSPNGDMENGIYIEHNVGYRRREYRTYTCRPTYLMNVPKGLKYICKRYGRVYKWRAKDHPKLYLNDVTCMQKNNCEAPQMSSKLARIDDNRYKLQNVLLIRNLNPQQQQQQRSFVTGDTVSYKCKEGETSVRLICDTDGLWNGLAQKGTSFDPCKVNVAKKLESITRQMKNYTLTTVKQHRDKNPEMSEKDGLDVYLLVDVSHSILTTNKFPTIKKTIEIIISKLGIGRGPKDTRLALIIFTTGYWTVFNQHINNPENSFKSDKDASAEIGKLDEQKCEDIMETRSITDPMSEVLIDVQTKIFMIRNGLTTRDAKQIIILLSDGLNIASGEITNSANELKRNLDTDIYSIFIGQTGNGLGLNRLNDLASDKPNKQHFLAINASADGPLLEVLKVCIIPDDTKFRFTHDELEHDMKVGEMVFAGDTVRVKCRVTSNDDSSATNDFITCLDDNMFTKVHLNCITHV